MLTDHDSMLSADRSDESLRIQVRDLPVGALDSHARIASIFISYRGCESFGFEEIAVQ